MLNFDALNLKEELLKAIQDMGFTEATPIWAGSLLNSIPQLHLLLKICKQSADCITVHLKLFLIKKICIFKQRSNTFS